MSVSINLDNNEDRNKLLQMVIEDSERLSRIKDKGLINQE